MTDATFFIALFFGSIALGWVIAKLWDLAEHRTKRPVRTSNLNLIGKAIAEAEEQIRDEK